MNLTLSSRESFVFNRQRRVVGEALRFVNDRTARAGGEGGSGEVIVNAPAGVVFPRASAVGPPGVLSVVVVEFAEDVFPSAVADEGVHPLALFGKEAGVFEVAAPVADVFFGAGDVDVAADEVFALVASALVAADFFGEPFSHEFHRLVFDLLPRVAAGAGREVERDDAEAGEVQLDEAPFVVEQRVSELVVDGVGLLFGVDGDAGVSGFLGEGEVSAQVCGRGGFGDELVLLRADFLRAEDVGFGLGEPLSEPLAESGANAVEVEGDDAEGHVFSGGGEKVKNKF